MGKLSALRTDPDKEISGIWVDYVDGIRFRIARMNNAAYEKFVANKQSTNPTIFTLKSQDPEFRNSVVCEAVANTVLLGWENLTADDGSEIPYTAAKALEIISNPEYRDVYNFILVQASNAANYKRAVLEAKAGN